MNNRNYLYDIFISYNRVDKDWVIKFAKRLKLRTLGNRKIKVFLDEWSIRAGESIPAAIRRGLNSSKHAAFIMTPEWVESDWCHLEVDTLIYSDPNARERRIIPILLRGCEIPDDIKRLKYIDFREHNRYEENLKYLFSELGSVTLNTKFSKFLDRQRSFILNSPILPWCPKGSPSLDFLWPELLIKPRLKTQKHPEPPSRLNTWLTKYDWNSSIALVGPPGMGKSTTLRSIFLEITEPEKRLGISFTPIFITAIELLDFAQSRFRSLINYILSKLKLSVPKRLTFPERLFFLIDGLDEVGESNIPLIFDILKNNVPEDSVLWTACREDFFFLHVANKPTWNAYFYEFLELLDWDEDEDAAPFISNYSENTKQVDLPERINTLKKSHPEIRPFLKNPFKISLLLYLLSDPNQFQPDKLVNAYGLYSAFYENWLIREHHRGTSKLPSDTILGIHQQVAYALYNSRGRGVELNEAASEYSDDIKTMLMEDTAFLGLLIKKPIPKSSNVRILRFWHETIGEFLVADKLTLAFRKGGTVLHDNLATVYRNEVNVFIRGAFECMNSSERDIIQRNLENLYMELIVNDPQKRAFLIKSISKQRFAIDDNHDMSIVNQEENSVRIREQIIYYMGRLPLQVFPQILRLAYYYEPNSLLRRIAALGAILHGDDIIEAAYLSKLTPNSQEDKENRSVQLVYFGDVEGDIHCYCDNYECEWQRTKTAIYDRLTRNGTRELRLRWWDLRTLYSFYESRHWKDSATMDELRILEETVIESSEFINKKKTDLELEKNKLIERLKHE